MVCLCLSSTKVWSGQNTAMRRRALWSRLQNISTAEFLLLRSTTGSSSQTKAGIESWSVFLDAAFLCMDTNYDVAGFNFVVKLILTPCSSHHPPTDCWQHWAPQSASFPEAEVHLGKFHPRGTSMEWLIVQKYNLCIYFTKGRVTNNLICARTGVW